jgi:hypothetical protein
MTLRVLHAPQLVGGHAPQLALAEREIGLQSRCISFWHHPFGYRCDELLPDLPDRPITNSLKRMRVLWRALREFDVVHFNFGMSLMPRPIESSGGGLGRHLYDAFAAYVELKDLPVLKRAGKAVFVTYQGDDARQGEFCRARLDPASLDALEAGYYTPESDARKRRHIRVFDRYADRIYALNPDLLNLLPQRARFLPYASVDVRQALPNGTPGAASRPLVIHAPSHRGIKGTRFVVDAVSRLRAEGLEFDFTLIEGMPNDEARRLYEKADLLVDQLLVGWYGGVAVELMAFGKPVVCFLRDDDLRFLDPEMRAQLPLIRADVGSIHAVLKACLTTERHRLPEIGRRGRAYVERWHDPLKIAQYLRDEYLAALRIAA